MCGVLTFFSDVLSGPANIDKTITLNLGSNRFVGREITTTLTRETLKVCHVVVSRELRNFCRYEWHHRKRSNEVREST